MRDRRQIPDRLAHGRRSIRCFRKDDKLGTSMPLQGAAHSITVIADAARAEVELRAGKSIYSKLCVSSAAVIVVGLSTQPAVSAGVLKPTSTGLEHSVNATNHKFREVLWFFEQDPRTLGITVSEEYRIVLLTPLSRPSIIVTRDAKLNPTTVDVQFDESVECGVLAGEKRQLRFDLPEGLNTAGVHERKYGVSNLQTLNVGSRYYCLLRCYDNQLRLGFAY